MAFFKRKKIDEQQPYSSKAYFHLPGLFEFAHLYENFLDIYTNEREKFNDWIEIDSLYGNPSDCIWGGGRRKAIISNIFSIADMMKRYNIKSALTFSNLLLEEEHLLDTYGNTILTVFNEEENYIILTSPLLEEHIRTHYPNYNFISSTTKCITNLDEINQELENNNYKLMCLDYNYNNNFDILKHLNNKDKCELLINPVCEPNCSRRKEHYLEISKDYLHQKISIFQCPYQGLPFYIAKQNPLFISKEAIEKTYLPMGYKHFKIEGRCAPDDDIIEILLYYLVKPEYQIEIRERLYGYNAQNLFEKYKKI